jgi:hypothetical protein
MALKMYHSAYQTLKQQMPCGSLIIAPVWENTPRQWERGETELERAVDRHYRTCPDCKARLAAAVEVQP